MKFKCKRPQDGDEQIFTTYTGGSCEAAGSYYSWSHCSNDEFLSTFKVATNTQSTRDETGLESIAYKCKSPNDSNSIDYWREPMGSWSVSQSFEPWHYSNGECSSNEAGCGFRVSAEMCESSDHGGIFDVELKCCSIYL